MELKEIWVWKGFVHKGNGKLLSCFVKLDNEYKIIEKFMYLVKKKKKDTYHLGGKYEIEITRDEEGKAVQIGERVYLNSDIPHEHSNDWRIAHWAEEEEAQKYKDSEKAIKDKLSIENLKLKDLKNFANKSYQNKRALKSYLENLF